MLLRDLFIIHNGLSSNKIDLSEVQDNFFDIPYIRPSNSFNRTIAGFINKASVPDKYIFPPNTIFVSTDGEGSHSYSYVSSFEFVPNSNVSVLIPKRNMSLKEKYFYAMCISRNRLKFSYGYKPKGKRLAENIDLPEKMPKYLEKLEIPNFENIQNRYTNNNIDIKNKMVGVFCYLDIFDISYGQREYHSKKYLDELLGNIPLISSGGLNNGVYGYFDIKPKYKNVISVPNTGSIGLAFYQEKDCCIDDNCLVLQFRDIKKFNKYLGLFFITLIRKEKDKYVYGRQITPKRLGETKIKLPVDKFGNPDRKFIEDYIKSLPYSKYL